MTMTRHEVLLALGPGGTMDIADRVIQLLAQQEAHLSQVDPFADLTYQPELGGMAEVCAALGTTPQKVGHWIAGRLGDLDLAFPDPLVVLAIGPVWELKAVRGWGKFVGLLESLEVKTHA